MVRLVTPGTITEDNLLDPGSANAFCALARVRGGEDDAEYGLAIIDISTGTFRLTRTALTSLAADLARLNPRELIISDSVVNEAPLRAIFDMLDMPIQPQPSAMFDSSRARARLEAFFNVKTLDGLGDYSRVELAAANAALAYVEKTQIGEKPALSRPTKEDASAVLQIDAATRASLELTRTQTGERTGSLISVMDRTITGAGARLLAERLSSPLMDPHAINARLDEVSWWLHSHRSREHVRDIFKRLADLPRALSRLALNRGGPRDLAAIAAAIETASGILAGFQDDRDGGGEMSLAADLPEALGHQLQTLGDAPLNLQQDIANTLAADLPLLARDGGFVASGCDEALDEQRALANESKRVIAALQAQYASDVDVKALKVRHNNMLGYFIEVTSQHADKLLERKDTFIHRQTMANAMRFTTTELADLESRIANAASRALQLELAHFQRLSEAVADHVDPLQALATALAQLDVASALAQLAEEQGYCRPLVDNSNAFSVTAGRHPVVEQALRRQAQHPFVANDCNLGGTSNNDDAGHIWLLTGPNMGGKSTFLRQNALFVVMAQMGSFIPAGGAHIGVADKLFSRVGASDDLARGRSTFMVEMVETAAILNQATERSLVVLDEIGRGTSTFDGLSIAWAAIEHLHEVNKSRTLFATHYHELTTLAAKLDRLATMTMKVKEWKGDVIFLHEVIEGSAGGSYGIQVARLAGLPKAVVDRAQTVLGQLEAQQREAPQVSLIDDLPLFSTATTQAPSASAHAPHPVLEDLAAVNPDDLTPRAALDTLYALRAALNEHAQ